MTDGLDQALAKAGLDLLRADGGLVVCDGQVPDGTAAPYVLVYTHVEWPQSAPDALDGLASSPVVRWYCHCVGATAIASVGVAQRVRTQLLNARPSFPAGARPGSTGLIAQESSQPPVRDETTGTLVMDSVATYKLSATA